MSKRKTGGEVAKKAGAPPKAPSYGSNTRTREQEKESALPAKPDETFPRRSLTVISGPSIEEKAIAGAQMITSPELAALRVVSSVEKADGVFAELIDSQGLLDVLRQQASAVQSGDLAHVEAMLLNQATALQALFARLSERAMTCNQIPGFESNMRVALRAQSQCRAALETLATIKNPPVIIAKQANVANGPQQVNNHARADQSAFAPSKLSEEADELRPNRSTPAIAPPTDLPLATLGTLHRPEIPGGEEARIAERFQGRRADEASRVGATTAPERFNP